MAPRLQLAPVLLLAPLLLVLGCFGQTVGNDSESTFQGSGGPYVGPSPGGCSSSSQCVAFADECAPGGVTGGAFSICAYPALATCDTDSDCPTGEVCGGVTCASADGGSTSGACVDACVDDLHCGVGLTCQRGHCTTPSCASDADCDVDLACSPSTHTCGAMPCQTDEQCEGFCVNKSCATAAGQCVPIPV